MRVELGRIGVWVGRGQLAGLSDAEAADLAAELERSGYGALWVGGSVPAELVPAAPVLGGSRRLAFATGIVNMWTAPAAEVASSYRRVNAAYPDRLLVGIGAGHREATAEYASPYDRLNEYLDVLSAEGVPPEHTALASLGPRVLRLAGRRTAGAHPYLVPPEHTRRARQLLGPGPLLAPEQKVMLETNPARARAAARRTVAFYLRLSNYVANLRSLGFTDHDLADEGSDRLLDALVAWGDVDAIAARVAEHHDAGADHVCIQVLTAEEGVGVPRDQLRRLGLALRGS